MEQHKASDRDLSTWYKMIKNGNIMLPRFQRFEAWDRKRITSLLEVIANQLPLGITLILKVAHEPQFISRFIETAPEIENKVTELLLDGQQRLTAFWRMMNNNYENETYFLYIPEWDKDPAPPNEENMIGYCQPRWHRKVNGEENRYPLWADIPSECYYRGLLPTDLLNPDNIDVKVDNWIDLALNAKQPYENSPDFAKEALEFMKKMNEKSAITNKITKLRNTIYHYNLSYLQLNESTSKDVALTVFINMNTNSKPLSHFDIVVAEVESVKGESLHDLLNDLDAKYPNIKHYFNLDYLTLYTSALLQNKIPNQKGIVEMDKVLMVELWNSVVVGLKNMAGFLETQRIFDRQRLPTNAVLAVIAAILSDQSHSPDKKGQIDVLLRMYLWRSFFTDRYENSAASRAYADYKALRSFIDNDHINEDNLIEFSDSDNIVFNEKEFPIASIEELKTVKWPKGENIRARAILAVSILLGAYDFADGQIATRDNLANRDYHHIFPQALLKEANVESMLALNCALISGSTNKSIGCKSPLVYLEDRYSWSDMGIVHYRLMSHLIPINELSNSGYSNVSGDDKISKIKADFEAFINARASLILSAVSKLCNGHSITDINVLV